MNAPQQHPPHTLPPPHGGKLREAAERYDIPLSDWLDLSTGINPCGWPVPPLPAEVWQRLPETQDGLEEAADQYYGSAVLPVAGSQAAIQALPTLRPAGRVGILSPCYAEHEFNWRSNGHQLVELTSREVAAQLPKLDVLVVVNPNNPTGERYRAETLRQWHQQLAARGGWLVVDEAFIDANPTNSVIQQTMPTGLIVLRSLGKFFGLAGARVGFVAACPTLLQLLSQQLGPWSINHPARWVATAALLDSDWQQQAQQQVVQAGQRLQKILDRHGLTHSGSELFRYTATEDALQIHQQMAQLGILTRLFEHPRALRFGLPATEDDWQQLDSALNEVLREI